MGRHRARPASGRTGRGAWPGYGRVAASSILNAYYTDPDVVLAVWDWLAGHGVTEGLGFEPGCGRGDWIAAAPDAVRFDAVDIDPISVRIATALTGANVVEFVHRGMAPRTQRPSPGQRRLRRRRRQRPVLVTYAGCREPAPGQPAQPGHRPVGGDAPAWRGRHGAHLTVLPRLQRHVVAPSARRRGRPGRSGAVARRDPPRGGHRSRHHLLILRRPLPGEQRPDSHWLDVEQLALDPDTTTTVNRYWADHPDHVLGRVEPGGADPRENFNVVADRPTHEALADALAAVRLAWAPAGIAPAVDDPAPFTVLTAEGRPLPAGSIVIFYQTSTTGFSRDGRQHPCVVKNRNQLKLLVTMRDRVLEYLDSPTDEPAQRARRLVRHLPGHPRTAAQRLRPRRDQAGQPPRRHRRRRRGRRRRDGGADPGPAALPEAGRVPHRSVVVVGRRPGSVRRRHRRGDPGADPATPDHRKAGREQWPDVAATIEQAVANSLARWHRIDSRDVAEQLAVTLPDADVQPAAVAFHAERGVATRRPLPVR